MTKHHTLPLRSNVPDQPIRIGQIWQERSRSFPASPTKRVMAIEGEWVVLQVAGAPYRKTSRVKVSSLIGQRRKYRLVQDVETENPD
jgi:hypothetical protein